mmetsp:Transcript_35728/g.83653  ORF Transcript_35728/g.83653 Transcript_35728/m.83653 type:complete len:201 (-) Transcript_35728:607-1209(-)
MLRHPFALRLIQSLLEVDLCILEDLHADRICHKLCMPTSTHEELILSCAANAGLHKDDPPRRVLLIEVSGKTLLVVSDFNVRVLVKVGYCRQVLLWAYQDLVWQHRATEVVHADIRPWGHRDHQFLALLPFEPLALHTTVAALQVLVHLLFVHDCLLLLSSCCLLATAHLVFALVPPQCISFIVILVQLLKLGIVEDVLL